MLWWKQPTTVAHAPEFIGAHPVQRATWFCLLCHCVEQDNGGRIIDAKVWGERRWPQTCGVTLVEVQDACDLWSWDGDDLVVMFYPREDAATYRAKVKAGRAGGKVKSQAKAAAAKQNGAKHQPQSEAQPKQDTKHNPSKNPTDADADTEADADADTDRKPTTPEPPRTLTKTPRDLLSTHRGHLEFYGNPAGLIEAEVSLASAIELHGADLLDRAITATFVRTRAKIHIADVLAMCELHRDRERLADHLANPPPPQAFPGLLALGEPKASP